jgi:protein-tyrosine phosphatase
MLRVLFVCTGNRCRSPFGAACLRAVAADQFLEVDSAGLLDLGGVPSTGEAIQVARSFGLDLTSHVSKSIAEVDLTSFDLIVGFERRHIAGAVVDGGAAYERAFVLPELVRLLDGAGPLIGDDPAEQARAVLLGAHESRGVDFVPGEEVADPIGRPIETYEKVFGGINEMVGRVNEALFGAALKRRIS